MTKIKTQKTKYFILRANTNDDYFDDRAKAFLVELTPKEIERIKTLIQKVQELKSFDSSTYSLELFDYGAKGLREGTLSEELEEDLDTCKYENKEITKAFADRIRKKEDKGEGDSIRIDTMTMVVYDDSVRWTGYYKHTNVFVESGYIMLKDL